MTQAKSHPSASAASNAGLPALWQWWTGELRTMLPPSMARWIDGDTVATNIMVDEFGLTIINTGTEPAKPFQAGHVPLDALPNHPVLRDLIATGRDRVRLVLTQDQAMVKSITLPMATEENLREVIGFELDRHTPFTPDQAYYDVQIERRDPQQEKIVVTLVVASKTEVAALVETLRRAGLTCTAIGVHAAAAPNATSVDLQPAADKPTRRLSRLHQVNLGLLGLAALLAFAAVVLPIWQKREAIKILIPQAEKAGAEFQVSERVYTEYTRIAAEYNFLATRKHAVYPVVSVLEELARTFPDTTWVQKLDIKPNGKVREVTLLGEAQSTSKVIENLEQSPLSLFQNSKQQSQTTRLQPNTERFHVSAEIKPRPVPASEGIDDITASATLERIAPAVTPMLPSQDPGAANPPAGSGSVAAVVAPARPAPAVVTSTPVTSTPVMSTPVPLTSVPAPSTGKSLPPTPASSSPPLTTYNGPPGPQSPPAIELVPPPVFNSTLTPFNPPDASYNTQNPPPGALYPPPIVPLPSLVPPGKRSGS